MMMQQFQSSFFKSSIVEQNIQEPIQQTNLPASEIVDQQSPNYFEKIMQEQFNQDNESEIDELKQLEDLINQQFYKDYNKQDLRNLEKEELIVSDLRRYKTYYI